MVYFLIIQFLELLKIFVRFFYCANISKSEVSDLDIRKHLLAVKITIFSVNQNHQRLNDSSPCCLNQDQKIHYWYPEVNCWSNIFKNPKECKESVKLFLQLLQSQLLIKGHSQNVWYVSGVTETGELCEKMTFVTCVKGDWLLLDNTAGFLLATLMRILT